MNSRLNRCGFSDPRWPQEMALRALADRYTDAVNQRDWSLYSGIWLPDAVLQFHLGEGSRMRGRDAIVAHAQLTIYQHDQFILKPRVFTLLGFQGSHSRARVTYDELARVKGARSTVFRRFVFIDQMTRGEDQVWRYAQRTCRLALLKRCAEEGSAFSHQTSHRLIAIA